MTAMANKFTARTLKLTKAEIRAAALVRKVHVISEIAEELGMSTTTVTVDCRAPFMVVTFAIEDEARVLS